jgi:hypothetical protein
MACLTEPGFPFLKESVIMWHIVRQYHLLELNSFLVHNLCVVGDQAGHGGSDHDVLTPAQHCEMVRSPPHGLQNGRDGRAHRAQISLLCQEDRVLHSGGHSKNLGGQPEIVLQPGGLLYLDP